MNKKVLYVDDEQPNLMLFRLTFNKNFEVLTAKSAEEGLKILDADPGVSVVISDLRMPGTNGLEFIRQARKKYDTITYCLLTGFDVTPEIDQAIQNHELDKYFRKPFNKEEVMDFILN